MSSSRTANTGILAFGLLICLHCTPQERLPDPAEIVKTGATVLVESDFDILRGKAVGLIGNQTSQYADQHLVDVFLREEAVDLAAIFAPEHGFRGEVEAGLSVGSDSIAAVPVFSLYGENRAPTPDMLAGIDVLVFDIQDIGARFYTYISTLGLAMQAAARADLEFVVLDRPNPIGGEYVGGPLIKTGNESFVGQYPIPIAHGLTVGELAKMIVGEGWLEDVQDLDLIVVPMKGWERSYGWPFSADTWIPTSPNIPTLETALVYPGICLLEATGVNEGRGTRQPFHVFGAPEVQAETVVVNLTTAQLPGVEFTVETYTPTSIPGVAASPKHQDKLIDGIRITVTNPGIYRPVETGIHVLTAIRDSSPPDYIGNTINTRWMRLLSGSDELRESLLQGKPASEILAGWQGDVESFREQREPYLLY